MRKKNFTLAGFFALGALLSAGETNDACKAAFEARNPFKIFLECGSLIADGEDPADANVWDYLAYARGAARGYVVDDYIVKKYNDRSLKSPGTNGRKIGLNYSYSVYARESSDWASKRQKAIDFNAISKQLVLFEEGYTLKKEGKKSAALKAYVEMAEALPTPMEYLTLAENQGDMGHPKEKAATLKKAIEMSEYYGAEAGEFYKRWLDADPKGFNKYLEGFDLATQYRKGKPAPAETAGVFERCAYLSTRFYFDGSEPGVSVCQEAIRQRPNDPWLHFYLANSMSIASLEKRIPAYEKAIALNPKFTEAYIELARRYLKTDLPKALELVEKGLKADPNRFYAEGESLLAHIYDELDRGEDFTKAVERYLTRRPFDHGMWRLWINKLVKTNRIPEALKATAGFGAAASHNGTYAERGRLLGMMGHHNLAALNFHLALEIQPNDSEVQRDLNAALEAQTTFCCSPPPSNPYSWLKNMPTLVRPPTDLTPKKAWTGLVSQWQTDGSLKLSFPNKPGIYFFPDGRYQTENADNTRGPLAEPVVGGDGRKVYPFQDWRLVYWPATGAMYFGPLEYDTPVNHGVHFLCSGKPLAGPYQNGIPTRLVRIEETTTEGEKTIARMTGGILAIREENQQDVLEIPGLGRFQGVLNPDATFKTGVFKRDAGEWDIYYSGRYLASTPQGKPTKAFPGDGMTVELDEDGTLTLRWPGPLEDTLTIFMSYGRSPYVAFDRRDKRTAAEIEADFEAKKRKEEIEEGYRQARNHRFERPKNTCYRCQGAGKVWNAGGATQFSRSAPSDYTPSQAEAWRNSSASVGVSYSSGEMVKCPICDGEGSY